MLSFIIKKKKKAFENSLSLKNEKTVKQILAHLIKASYNEHRRIIWANCFKCMVLSPYPTNSVSDISRKFYCRCSLREIFHLMEH